MKNRHTVSLPSWLLLVGPTESNEPAANGHGNPFDSSSQIREKSPANPISKKGFQVAISGFRNVLSIGPDEQASNPWAKFILETEIAREGARNLHSDRQITILKNRLE
jgi:hypothetical protein